MPFTCRTDTDFVDASGQLVRECTKCRLRKPLNAFAHGGDTSKHRRLRCHECLLQRSRESYARNREARRRTQMAYVRRRREEARTDRVLWSKQLVQQVKARCKYRGITCTITHLDVPIPEGCPALGVTLIRAVDTLSEYSASIDRIRPSLGYVPGNVIVVSLKANMIKSNALPDEILAVGHFYKSLSNNH